jgi:hypothetical protein
VSNFLGWTNQIRASKCTLTDIQETENHITISQSSARISYGEEPEGAGTVRTKPGNFGKNNKSSF